MSYIIFNDDETRHEASVMPFNTQHGVKAVRIVSEPLEENESGFKFYDDDDNLLGDFSEYTNLYRDNEYSIEADEIVPGSGSDAPLPPSALALMENSIGRLSAQLNQVSSEVDVITPYVETKTAYIDDTEIIFDIDKKGVITINAEDRDGNVVPTTFEREENKIIVTFESPLEQVTNVTISIQ